MTRRLANTKWLPQYHYSRVQSKILKPSTRSNSWVLLVTRINPRLRAWPAMWRSLISMIVPLLSRSALNHMNNYIGVQHVLQHLEGLPIRLFLYCPFCHKIISNTFFSWIKEAIPWAVYRFDDSCIANHSNQNILYIPGERVSAGRRTAWVLLFSKTEPTFTVPPLCAIYIFAYSIITYLPRETSSSMRNFWWISLNNSPTYW